MKREGLKGRQAIELGIAVCRKHKIKMSKDHMARICRMRGKPLADGTPTLRFFPSMVVAAGRGGGLSIVNTDGDFEANLLEALKEIPYVGRKQPTRVPTASQVIPKGGRKEEEEKDNGVQ